LEHLWPIVESGLLLTNNGLYNFPNQESGFLVPKAFQNFHNRFLQAYRHFPYSGKTLIIDTAIEQAPFHKIFSAGNIAYIHI
jgi:hypothetical protein